MPSIEQKRFVCFDHHSSVWCVPIQWNSFQEYARSCPSNIILENCIKRSMSNKLVATEPPDCMSPKIKGELFFF